MLIASYHLSPSPSLGDAGTQLRETTADFFALGRANPALASGLFRVLLKVFLSSSHSNQGITILLVFLHSPHPCNSGGNITWKTGSKYGQSLHFMGDHPCERAVWGFCLHPFPSLFLNIPNQSHTRMWWSIQHFHHPVEIV